MTGMMRETYFGRYVICATVTRCNAVHDCIVTILTDI